MKRSHETLRTTALGLAIAVGALSTAACNATPETSDTVVTSESQSGASIDTIITDALASAPYGPNVQIVTNNEGESLGAAAVRTAVENDPGYDPDNEAQWKAIAASNNLAREAMGTDIYGAGVPIVVWTVPVRDSEKVWLYTVAPIDALTESE